MKLFVTYSDVTEHLLRKFYLPSVPSYWNVTVQKLPDEVALAGDKLMRRLTVWAYRWIADTLEKYPGECLLFTGCDQYYRGDCEDDLKERLGFADLASPSDGWPFCGDLRYVRSSPRTVNAFRKGAFQERHVTADQRYWWRSNYMMEMVRLPASHYWGLWANACGYWEPFIAPPLPPKTALWIHGNGTKMENKAELLKRYQEAA